MDKSIIAIGALGGSGTRIVAEIIQQLNVYIGDVLNHANDNLIFTLLFKNPDWYKKCSAESFNERLQLFRRYMENDQLTEQEFSLLSKIGKENTFVKFYDASFDEAIKLKIRNTKTGRKIWAWKEPNTQVFLDSLLSAMPRLKYVHVLRHGLDMAFSKNKQQLKNWGYLFDIHLNGDENEEELAYKQLCYWIESTKKKKYLSQEKPDRILVLNFEKLCSNPKEEIDRIIAFTKLDLEKINLETIYQLPQTPNSAQRFKDYDLGIFDQAQLDYVRQLGFEI